MIYTDLFRQLREARGLSHETLAIKAGLHRNTVINVESGRPVKFRTIAKLMTAMGASRLDTKTMALMWVEAASGMDLTSDDKVQGAVSKHREPEEKALAELRDAAKKLRIGDIKVLTEAAKRKGTMLVLSMITDPRSLE
jgi:transcriptional regulator with XRE-family HTH domain